MYGGNLRFKTDRASLLVGSKFTVSLCFTLYLNMEGLIFGILRYQKSNIT